MNQGQLEVNYEQFFLTPVKERRNIFTEITAENRAFLIKTHAERWLAANRSRLTDEQVSVVEELIQSISPEWYKPRLDFSVEIHPEAEIVVKKVEAVLSREDVKQLAANRAEHIPVVEDENN
jgi:carbamoylphosphate synthase small subunit